MRPPFAYYGGKVGMSSLLVGRLGPVTYAATSDAPRPA